jgi:predicted MPP superfamily phosphohydrolase
MTSWRAPAALTAAAGAATLAYGAVEARSFRLREVAVPVLPPGTGPLRVLHVSDLHLTPGQARKRRWVAELAALEPDLVVSTGDHLAHPEAVPAVLEAFDGLLRRPGVFVLGSNDYYGPVLKNPGRYLLPDNGERRLDGAPLPWPRLVAAFEAAGWVDLDNVRTTREVAGLRLEFVGTDDPHLELDDYPTVAGSRRPDVDLGIGVTHAPYLRVLDAMLLDGFELLLAGHTHGGQLCLPGGRALVTNCDLEPARASGLSRHPADGGHEAAWLHVSAGLGTSPTAPVRFACPPEATLLTLVPRQQ